MADPKPEQQALAVPEGQQLETSLVSTNYEEVVNGAWFEIMFKPIIKWEALPSNIVKLIYQHGRFIVSGQIDQEFGAGQIDVNTKAVWTTNGKRIEVFLKDAFIISQSRDVDPLYSERKGRNGTR